MPLEIERKFLVADETWRADVLKSQQIRQGYISRSGPLSARVRTIDGEAFLTIKSRAPGIAREEFEYPLPFADAETMLALCEKPLVEKTRHTVLHHNREWIIDEFTGEHAGLLLAECELHAPDEAIDLPVWTGAEVTDDPAYRNEAL